MLNSNFLAYKMADEEPLPSFVGDIVVVASQRASPPALNDTAIDPPTQFTDPNLIDSNQIWSGQISRQPIPLFDRIAGIDDLPEFSGGAPLKTANSAEALASPLPAAITPASQPTAIISEATTPSAAPNGAPSPPTTITPPTGTAVPGNAGQPANGPGAKPGNNPGTKDPNASSRPSSASASAGLTTKAKPTSPILPPSYPSVARKRGVEGKVEVKVVIAADGKLEKAEIRLSPGDIDLENAALAAVKSVSYTPAISEGKTIRSELIIPFNFKLND